MANGRLLHVCISNKKGIGKHEIATATLLVDYGIEGDAHAGQWHRQVSVLAHSDIEFMRGKGLSLKPGAFGENFVIDGLNTDELGVGSRLRVGPALLELTQVGKVCHTRCAIYYAAGECIMPRTGLFARVVESGEVTAGMPVQITHRVDRSTLQAAVITISDRCSAGQTLDTAGPAVGALLSSELRANIAWTAIVPDEVSKIAEAIKDFTDRRVDIIVTVGGTGPDVRDVTPEATRGLLDRELPGLAEAMRAVSSAKTPHALLSRAIAGIRRETLILNLPGSKKAACEILQAILQSIPHAVKILRKENVHPENDVGRMLTTL